VFVALVLAVTCQAPSPDALPDAGPTDPVGVATALGRGLLAGDVEALSRLTPPGFSFDGRVVWNAADIKAEWLHALEQRPLAGVPLYGVEVVTADEMQRRYGKPPARLSQLNLTGAQVAIVNLGGRAMLVFFKKKGDAWVPIGVSD
jgi:hypothetical protein